MSSRVSHKRKKGGNSTTIFLKKNRIGLSAVIGYVLIIAISITMSIVVYSWLKTFVPAQELKCPDGTSVFIRDLAYTCTPGAETLNITLKNNGKFSVNGYFIQVSNDSNLDALPTIDISSRIRLGGNVSANSIVFSYLIYNYLTPGEPTNVRMSSFNVSGYGRLYKVSITPSRIEEQGTKKKSVICSAAKIEEEIACK